MNNAQCIIKYEVRTPTTAKKLIMQVPGCNQDTMKKKSKIDLPLENIAV